ncbi:hypothetical protein ACOMHN_014848 [Nucella lapillus]
MPRGRFEYHSPPLSLPPPLLASPGPPPGAYLHHPSEYRHSRLLLGEGGHPEGEREEEEGTKGRRNSGSGERQVCGWRDREIQCQEAEDIWVKKGRGRNKSADVTGESGLGRPYTQLTFRPLPGQRNGDHPLDDKRQQFS